MCAGVELNCFLIYRIARIENFYNQVGYSDQVFLNLDTILVIHH